MSLQNGTMKELKAQFEYEKMAVTEKRKYSTLTQQKKKERKETRATDETTGFDVKRKFASEHQNRSFISFRKVSSHLSSEMN